MNTKKIIIGIALLGSTFFYGACKNSPDKKETDKKTTITKEAFVGTWVGKGYSSNVQSITPEMLQGAQTIVKATGYTFNADGTFEETVFNHKSTGNWYHNADSNTFQMVYSKTETNTDRLEPVYTIKQISDSTLVLQNQLQHYGIELYSFIRKKQ